MGLKSHAAVGLLKSSENTFSLCLGFLRTKLPHLVELAVHLV